MKLINFKRKSDLEIHTASKTYYEIKIFKYLNNYVVRFYRLLQFIKEVD